MQTNGPSIAPAGAAGSSVRLHEVLVDIQSAMKHPKDIDVVIWLYEIGYSVVTVEQNSDVTTRWRFVLISCLGMPFEDLRFFVNTLDGSNGSFCVVCRDVIMNILQPGLRFPSPAYFCQVFIRRCISSFVMVRPSSASFRPRCTINSKASSRTISS